MFNKFNIKQLLIIFGILLALVLIVNLLDKKSDSNRSFKSELVVFDNDEIDKITVYPRAHPESPFTFTRKEKDWRVESNGKQYRASSDVVNSMLTTLKNLKAERIAANNKDKWEEYNVNDSTATRVRLENSKGKKISDIYCGKFNYTQPKDQNPAMGQRGKITSFVRLKGEAEVYAVDGYVSMAFDRDLKYLRDPKIISSSYLNWNKVTVSHPADSAFTLEKQNNQWFMNGQLADSTSVVTYLSGIQRLNSTDFYDEPVLDKPLHKITIEGNTLNKPIEISAYSLNNNPVVSSTENPETFFDGTPNELFSKLFQRRPVIKTQ